MQYLIKGENLPTVKSISTKSFSAKPEYHVINCKTKYYFKIPGKMLSHNWLKRSYSRTDDYKTLLYYSMYSHSPPLFDSTLGISSNMAVTYYTYKIFL